jgi:outer membrane lipoprotein SlyB
MNDCGELSSVLEGDFMRVRFGWLVGLLVGAALGATWGWFGNSYESGDSAIGTGLMGAVAGIILGAIIDTARYAKKPPRRP